VGEDEIEAGLEELFRRGVGLRMREGVARRGELLEEALGDREMEAAQFGGERVDGGRLRVRRCRLCVRGSRTRNASPALHSRTFSRTARSPP